jgi:CelD/BcsL family acetyltransferase involved in cellulose biosynthesis
LRVSLAENAEEISEISEQVRHLTENAVSKNIFYEDWMLIPALKYLKNSPVTIVLIWDEQNGSLAGLFPLEIRSGYRRMPMKYYSLWRHPHCYLCTPLVANSSTQEVLNCFFDWLEKTPLGKHIFRFEQIIKDDLFYHSLMSAAKTNKLSFDQVESFDRPYFETHLDSESYIKNAISTKHFKDITKKKKKLAALGELKFNVLTSNDELVDWISDFLILEKSGWKGLAETALSTHTNEQKFFESIVRTAYSRKQLIFLALTLNGRPVSMRCGFRNEKGEISFKIAFDEKYSKFSPGALLELEHIKFACANNIDWADSCASPGSTLLERFWTEKLPITSITVSSSKLLGKMLVTSLGTLGQMKKSVLSPERRSPEKPGELHIRA